MSAEEIARGVSQISIKAKIICQNKILVAYVPKSFEIVIPLDDLQQPGSVNDTLMSIPRVPDVPRT